MTPRTIEIDIVDLANTGQAVGYDNGKVTFVTGGLPGERVEAEVIKTRRNFNQARLVRLVTRSADRVSPICRHYDVCGGCSWQDLDYDRQLYYKRKQVVACLEHIGGFEEAAVDEIRPSPDRFYYRNKMEFSFHLCTPEVSSRGFVFGLHERGRFDRIFDVERCHLQSERSNDLVNFLRGEVVRLGIPVYGLLSHQGFLRFAVVREGKNSGQWMLILITGEGEFVGKEPLAAALRERFPDLTTLVWMVNDTLTNIARGDVREVLHGPGYIEDTVLGLRFRIGPTTFFQTNIRQTEALYEAALDYADAKPSDRLLDLYCGTGTIGLCAAGRVREVVGIDIEEESIAMARINAEVNRIGNGRFIAAPAHVALAAEDIAANSFDVVVVDPPRAGLHPKAMDGLAAVGAPGIVYISCNPATFARDAALLRQEGYRLDRVTPFDMFPHTMHTELVARFEKNG
jgi:23S rRNA (uracil1939-C5)-methyltransferase